MAVDLQEYAATIVNHFREVEDNTPRMRQLLYYMQQNGSFEFGLGGDGFDWRVKYGQQGFQSYDDNTIPRFNRSDRYKVATLAWKSYQIGDHIDKLKWERNQGNDVQIINLLDDMVGGCQSDFEALLPAKFLQDVASDTKGFDGIETCLAATTTTGSGGKTRDPNDTYAGIQTNLGVYGGSWTGDWPSGNGTVEYDFWSPILVNTTHTAWGSSPTFAKFGEQQLRFAINMIRRSHNAGGPPDICLMTTELLEALQNIYSGSDRIMVDATPRDLAVGFRVYNFDGVALGSDFDVPADTIYVLNTQQFKYKSVKSTFIEMGTPRWLPDGSKLILDGYVHGNLQMNPRAMAKLYPYGA